MAKCVAENEVVVKLELSEDEASWVRTLIGNFMPCTTTVEGKEILNSVWDALNNAGVPSDAVRWFGQKWPMIGKV